MSDWSDERVDSFIFWCGLCEWPISVWSIVGCLSYVTRHTLHKPVPRVWITILSEIKPFYWIPFAAGNIIHAALTGTSLSTFITVVSDVIVWYVYKNLTDDRWQKRREKALEKVEQVGSKLVVSPT